MAGCGGRVRPGGEKRWPVFGGLLKGSEDRIDDGWVAMLAMISTAPRPRRPKQSLLPGPGFELPALIGGSGHPGPLCPSAAAAGVLVGLFGLGGGIAIVPALFFLYVQQDFPAELCSTSRSAARSRPWSSPPSPRHGPSAPRRGPVAGGAALVAGDRGGRGARGSARRARAGPVPAGLLRLLRAPGRGPACAGPRPDPRRDLLGTGGMWFAGTGIGALSTLLGIGGGTLTVPLLVYCNVPIHQAVGTSAARASPMPSRS